jgi:hypothetical protein
VLGKFDIPLRLLDCLGLTTPVLFFDVLAGGLGAVGFAFLVVAEGWILADWITGEDRKADGEGIVIVSIMSATHVGTSTHLFGDLAIGAVVESFKKILVEDEEAVVVEVVEGWIVNISIGVDPSSVCGVQSWGLLHCQTLQASRIKNGDQDYLAGGPRTSQSAFGGVQEYTKNGRGIRRQNSIARRRDMRRVR